jgi:high-affinity iron transporter
LREGIETIIFMAGVTGSLNTGGGSWRDLPIPSIVAIITAIGVAVLLFKGIMKLDIKIFFDVSSAVLIAFAAAMLSYG